MIAISGFLTALECTKIIIGLGSTPDPAGGAPDRPLAGLRGSISKGRGGEQRKVEAIPPLIPGQAHV